MVESNNPIENVREEITQNKRNSLDTVVEKTQQARTASTYTRERVAPIIEIAAELYGDIIDFAKKPLYKKESVGEGGELFHAYKGRSMREGADNSFADRASESIDHMGNVSGGEHVTLLGKFLRMAKLDELPQVINILLGQMKLIGVRPHGPEHIETMFPPRVAEKIKKQKPGLAGVNYTFPKGGCYIEETEKYLDAYEARPIRTQVKYAFKLALNTPRIFSTG